eukprot:CAMPEP_0185829664 /NCGR_PEP_ID=MMETSP1353-20130828/382_1 /TAXON_ID=1077150 /ORGANISM="Erythrolobus australicus, Strain CCMP3124" /LENGTH=432 /DNA_ID=CAMNT_0028527481 /DNA_START=18 /DNA_END=1316 /DNA_ORIENTATION=+
MAQSGTLVAEKKQQQSGRSIWEEVPEAPVDPILGVAYAFRADSSKQKLNLGVGAYRTEEGKPYVLPVVARVHRELLDANEDHEYLPIEGYAPFTEASAKLILGPESPAIAEDRVITVQALSGTGSLRVAFEFIRRFYRNASGELPSVYVPNPTWSNHRNIVPDSGLAPTKLYNYYDAASGGVDMKSIVRDLSAANDGDVVIFHGCAHNPTGADLSMDQWRELLELCTKKRLLPLFDNAYQGFASGDLTRDAGSVRLFVDAGLDVVVTQSYAKNMGLYGERVGALSLVMSSKDPKVRSAVLSQLKQVIRAMYSNPPALGAKIAARILRDPELFAEWERELVMMSKRIYSMRVALRDALVANGTAGNWDHIVSQIGMFSYTGLTAQHVQYMREKYHIYMTSNGRISLAGLNPTNVKYLADAMKDATSAYPMGKL